jgi:hypothetical protein
VSVLVSDEDWESLVGSVLKEDTDELDTLLRRVDTQNSLTRYYLGIKWLDGAAPRPGDQQPIEEWPPWVSDWFVSYSPFTKEWVEEYVASRTTNPIYILVTKDPSREIGWYELDVFFS